MSFTQRLATFLERGLLFEGAIVAHGFARHVRDYDLTVEPATTSDGRLEARYRFRFTHCRYGGSIVSSLKSTFH
jgi:hypothetical protein